MNCVNCGEPVVQGTSQLLHLATANVYCNPRKPSQGTAALPYSSNSPEVVKHPFNDKYMHTEQEIQDALLLLYRARVHVIEKRMYHYPTYPGGNKGPDICRFPEVDSNDKEAWHILSETQSRLALTWATQDRGYN